MITLRVRLLVLVLVVQETSNLPFFSNEVLRIDIL